VIRRVNANVVALLLLGGLSTPALASADSGGASLGAGGTSSRVVKTGTVQPGDVTATVSGNGVTLSARISAILRHQLRFAGSVPSYDVGRTIVVERLDKQAGWIAAATGIAAQDGSFSAVWRTDHIGRMATRVIVRSKARFSTRTAASSPVLNVTVYRPSLATTFGEGFYGSQTACGQTLTSHTLGVAHRWLPCGTRVAIYWHARTIVVPVIDRGPYANNADWDLTDATARALGINGTETIGAVSLQAGH
jgi:peptidoglycan lytic transglycosylase